MCFLQVGFDAERANRIPIQSDLAGHHDMTASKTVAFYAVTRVCNRGAIAIPPVFSHLLAD